MTTIDQSSSTVDLKLLKEDDFLVGLGCISGSQVRWMVHRRC
jgi:hypothetical protein